MTAYIIRRVLWMIPVLWAVATITFFMMHAVPGGPFTSEKDVPESVLQALNRRYDLDKPLWEQYLNYLLNLLQGDLGLSFRGDREVSQLISDGFFVTLQLGIMSFVVAVVVGMSLGIVSALNRNGPADYLGVFFATVGASVPNFIAGTFLIIIFAIQLDWFKIVGWGGPQEWSEIFSPGAYDLRKMVLPVVALALLPSAFIARIMRASMLEVLNQDYIRTAQAKGLAFNWIVFRHTIKNAMIPVLTVMGPIFATLITGSFIIESLFSIPGVGGAFVDAVIRRDYGMIMGVTLFYAFIIAVVNLITDIAYAVVDPRIRYS
jgi:oligopeptide transport system permease protein